MASPLGSPVSGTVKAPSQSSAKTHNAAGSGSRPGSVRFPIDSSAPADPHKLDGRGDVAGALGSGKTKQQGA